MISAWYYLLDILVTGITHDKRTTITLPPSMGLSWLSGALVLTIGFLGSPQIASRVRVIFSFSRLACHSFRIAINNFAKLASYCHNFYTDTCFRPGVYYNRCNRPRTVSFVHIVMPRESMKNLNDTCTSAVEYSGSHHDSMYGLRGYDYQIVQFYKDLD